MKRSSLLICAALAATPASPAPRGPSESTREMAALLQECATHVDPKRLTFAVNERRAQIYEARLLAARTRGERLDARFEFALELLNAGRNDDALKVSQALEEDARAYAPGLWEVNTTNALILRALAHLRTAEEQNCCLLNNRDSCLLPISGGGIHQKREGSTRAIETLLAILD